jgi:predicted Rossmann fold flavoprotein
MEKMYDLIIIGAGAAGMTAAITAARNGMRVVLLEKMPRIGTKLKATGGGRCNLTNTLDHEAFMSHFGRDGKFMMPVLDAFDHQALVDFMDELGVKCHAPDGFRIFPVTHSSVTIIHAMQLEMERLGVDIRCGERVDTLLYHNGSMKGVCTQKEKFFASDIIIATGGKGYPALGAEGDGYHLAESAGHHITALYPAMMPLKTKERWVASCRADTLPKVELRVNMKKYKKLHAKGDLIFTKEGIRGPVVLDFSREITPLLAKFDEVPLVANFTKGMDEEQIRTHIKRVLGDDPHMNTLQLTETLLPSSVARVLCDLSGADSSVGFKKQLGRVRDNLVKLLVWTPLTVIGHEGFKMAMITRGGVSLKEIDPYTMKSRKVKGLYFCGEVVDLDGPCGGYNLQWAFASGYVAAKAVFAADGQQ